MNAQSQRDSPIEDEDRNTLQFIPEEQIAQMSTSEASYTAPYVCA